ncbi:MAG: DUF2550 family protein [Dermatophilaceae bacterium]
MSQVLVTAEIVIGVCAVLGIAFLFVVFVRRRILARGGDLMLCALQRSERSRWKPGLLRFDDANLAWFPLFGVSLRPRHCWERAGLELGNGNALHANQPRFAEEDQAVRARLSGNERRKGRGSVELGLARAPYTALRSWVEASSPGHQPMEW